MNHVWYERRVHLAGIIGFVLFALWLVLGPPATRPVMSGWNGDAVANAAPQASAAPEQLAAVAAGVTARNGVSPDVPWGNPLGNAATVLNQGYGVGTHAPAATWGGIDLGVDADGDGRSNPDASMGAPLYATMRGVIDAKPNTYPAGNHIWIKNDRYKVGYAHMLSFAVESGQTVEPGDLIGYVGATGQVTGPHLHYHIWEDGVNVNPLNFGALPE